MGRRRGAGSHERKLCPLWDLHRHVDGGTSVLRGGEDGGALGVGVVADRIVDLDRGGEGDRADGEGSTCGEGVAGRRWARHIQTVGCG